MSQISKVISLHMKINWDKTYTLDSFQHKNQDIN